MYTTLSKLAKAGACRERFRHLVNALGGIKTYGKHTPIAYQSIMELNGIIDCVWALCHGGDETLHIAHLWAIACLQEIRCKHQYPSLNINLRMMHLYVHGEITREELINTCAVRSTEYSDWMKLDGVCVIKFALCNYSPFDIYDVFVYHICLFPRPIPLDRQIEILNHLLQHGAKQ